MSGNRELLRSITVRRDVFSGEPIVRDLQVSVELVLSLLAQGAEPEAILDDYPDLDLDGARACAAYAHAVISGDASAAVREFPVAVAAERPSVRRSRGTAPPHNSSSAVDGDPVR